MLLSLFSFLFYSLSTVILKHIGGIDQALKPMFPLLEYSIKIKPNFIDSKNTISSNIFYYFFNSKAFFCFKCIFYEKCSLQFYVKWEARFVYRNKYTELPRSTLFSLSWSYEIEILNGIFIISSVFCLQFLVLHK